MCLVPVFAVIFFSSIPNSHIYALVVFLVASLTDMLDGYIARKFNLVSVIGIVLDPLADKMMLLTVLVCLTVYGAMPLWAMLIMLISETILIVGNIFAYFQKSRDVVPANKLGKTATVLFAAAVVLMILLPGHPLTWGALALALATKLISFFYYGVHFIGSHPRGM